MVELLIVCSSSGGVCRVGVRREMQLATAASPISETGYPTAPQREQQVPFLF